jgi:DNA-binding NarL/FixJ family response regulator
VDSFQLNFAQSWSFQSDVAHRLAITFGLTVADVRADARDVAALHRANGGVSGFVLKDAPVEVFAGAIRRGAAGEEVIDPTLAARALRASACPLSTRERETLAACADGLSTAELATRLWHRQCAQQHPLTS